MLVFYYFLFLIPVFLASENSCKSEGFVFLADIDSSIIQDIRYYSAHNFVGRRIEGYNTASCMLSLQAASALSMAQQSASRLGMSLKVYDCFRPQRAVNDFIAWANNSYDLIMKEEFYPTLDKDELFPDYIATK
jgi:D-alanyl-D-alanine dipeptidase